MNNLRSVSELVKILPELLENGKTVSFTPNGVSMLPTIKTGDTVTLKKTDKLKKYDIVLYVRNDGKAILHRLIGFDKNGGYIMCGDSQIVREYGITDKNVIAKVVSFTHGNKTTSCDSILFKLKTLKVLLIRLLKRIKNKIIRTLKKD